MKSTKTFITAIALLIVMGLLNTKSYAHCDRENGPVAVAAKEALKTGDFSKVVIWVGEEQEEELRKKFKQSLAVYQKGDDSRELAKDYFMSNAVRLHRAAEGMPFTGLKPASPAAKDIQVAEKALKTGNLDPVMKMFSSKLEGKTQKWFQKALKAKKNKDNSIEAGREWANSYVKYIVYLHKLYLKIEQGPPHGVGE
jgi:cell division inhibitor SulA